MLEIRVHHYNCAFAEDNSDCRAAALADKEDGRPRQKERKTQRGDEPDGEKIQRARRERDLAESNARDLEHQKGVLSEQLVATSEQLRCKSKELASASM